LFGAGALLLGKTNMHELAFGITSANPAYGNVHNPYDASMIAGGSSGGSAAAIAARMCPVGLGTDTGGSVRIPAALCGIAGLRPTVGRYSQDGIVPLSHTRDTAGPMARSIQDLALLDSVLSGTSQALSAAVVAGLRLGVPRGYFYEDLDPDLAPVIESALRKLRDAGCVLIEADIPRIEQLCAISGGIVFHEFAADLQRYLSASGADTTVQEVARQIASPDVKALYEENVVGASAPTSAWYQKAMASGRPALQAAYRDYFRVRDVEAIVLPTTRLAARPLGQDVAVELNGKVVSTFLAYLHNTHPITTAGMPGLSIPVGLTSSGLPVGLEFDALQGQDRRLLGIGLGVEGLFDRLPSPVP
jgi:mandelamide amidase